MVLITLFLSLFLFRANASSGDFKAAIRAKDYEKVSETYRNNPERKYSREELIFISFALRKLHFFRQDTQLNIRLVKQNYPKQHKKLLAAIQRAETVDGDDYPEALKVLYWNLFTSYGEIIKGYEKDSSLVTEDNKYFTLFGKILSELEFREGKVDKYNDTIMAHRQYLTNKVYKFTRSWSLQYISWQQSASIQNNSGGKAGLIITNKGYCVGGDAGYENYRYRFFVDGCFLYGSGGVKNYDQDFIDNYQQSNLPAYGVKAGPGASMIVSSSKSSIGIKLPMIYSVQKLTTPSDPGYSIKQGSSLTFVASLYSRWQFNKWYFQTEFGQYINKQQTFWGLGIGKEF